MVLKSLYNPKFPRNVPPYRVYWNWDITYRCNYRCSYCEVWRKGEKGHNPGKKYPYFGVEKWKKVWDRIFENYGCCHVRFSGGEPTIYPDFFDLVALLLEKHTVDITTNLNFDINLFVKKVKPGGISISSSFHPKYDEIKPFLEKVLFLHHNGYPSTICYVAYPLYLEKMRYFKSITEEKGIMFKIIPFTGKFQGKDYPQFYTHQEKSLIEGSAADSKDPHLNELNTRWYEWNVVKRDEEEGVKKGKLCRMGQMYAVIHPDGEITRCCAGGNGRDSGSLGNIFDRDFRLLDEPAPCQAERCPCFKAMLVGCGVERWLPLWEALDHPVYKTEYMKRFVEKGSHE